MGKPYSKIEEKEVIITQNSSGSNAAGISETENHVRINNVLITTFLALIAVVIITLLCFKLKERHKKWIDGRINAEFLRRMRYRLSGRRGPEQEEGEP